METDHQRLRAGLLNIALKWGQGIGRRGEPYGWLIDCRELLLQSDYLERACRLLWQRVQDLKPQCVVGYTMAAHPLAVGLKLEAARNGRDLSVQLIRRAPKADGLQRQIEGPPLTASQRVVLVDDLINSGETQHQALEILAPSHAEVLGIATLIDYQRGGSQALRDRGLNVTSLFTLQELGVATATSPPELQPLWSVPGINGGGYSAPKSSACLGPERLWIGSDQGALLCLDRSGNELWRYKVRDRERGVHSSPVERDGRVYFGSYDGYCTCLNSESGALIWEIRAGDWIGSSPILGEKLLYIGLEFGQRGGSLGAFDIASGALVWEAPARHYVHSTPCLVGDRAIFAGNDGVVRAHEAHTGEELWRFYTQGPIQSPLSADDRQCYIASGDGILYTLDLDTGKEVWKRRLSRRLYCKPLVAGELVVVGGDNSCLAAMDRSSGEVRWVHALGGSLVGGLTQANDSSIWAGSNKGQLWRLDHQGRTLGRFSGPAAFRTVPSHDADEVVIGDVAGNLYAFASQSQRS